MIGVAFSGIVVSGLIWFIGGLIGISADATDQLIGQCVRYGAGLFFVFSLSALVWEFPALILKKILKAMGILIVVACLALVTWQAFLEL